ncbi:hypothetical protein Ddye_010415 [Dipteronia dyeriana]|uniref:Zinc-finger domain-containing protein n=1 Tax=Dipteronia dyeriana TaxID=168575 RepID=A0AAD9XDH5_9ROSI|nr:hypothetical protein Ddye_010415 [Dipteronia dyeriana]
MPNPKTLKETQQNPKTYNSNNHGQKTPNVSLYEQSREDRIKDNLQRMQKLGILDLSVKLKSSARTKRTPKNSPSDSQGSTSLLQSGPRRRSSRLQNLIPEEFILLQSGPRRRSSRLQNVTPVSYSERQPNRDNCVKDEDLRLEQGSKPEVYTEEQEKLLGNTERSWTLFVDGYGTDGKRIYDPVKGKTCHQCRQKTLGHRTQCSECNKVQGQFCGDCLYMRYGEHVLEANENPNWICPVCRGICNCSLCRQAKGWCPTGTLYKKISNLGFKSVAHYLIETHRMQTNLDKNPETVNQASSVKRSLSFKDMEALLEESSKVDKDQRDNNDLDIEKENILQNHSNAINNHQTAAKRSLPFSYIEAEPENNSTEEIKVLNHIELSKPRLEDQRDSGVKDEQEKKLHYTDEQIALKSSPKPKKKRAAVVPSPDSIAGRLRHRCGKVDDGLNNKELVLYVGPASNNLSEKEKEMKSCDDEHGDSNQTSDEQEKKLHYTDEQIALKNCPKPKKKRAAVVPSPDSIAGRLRQRRRIVDDGLNNMELVLYAGLPASNNLSEKEKEMQGHDDEGLAGMVDKTSEEEVVTNMKLVSSEEAGPDSIARRLRSRSQTT